MINLILEISIYAFIIILLVYAAFLAVIPKKIPKRIPKSMEKTIKRINKKNLTDLQFVKVAYKLVDKKYASETGGVLKRPLRIFKNDLSTIWNTKRFQPCANQNYILKVLLIKSKRFTKDDIKLKINTKYIIWPHQYYKVKIKNKWYDIDLWGADHKIKFGKHLGI